MLGGDAKPTRAPRETRKRNSVAKERVEPDEEELVRLYLTDIGQYPLLTKEDEVRLGQAIDAGVARRTAVVARPRAPSCSRPSASWCRSPRSTRRPVCPCLTSFKRATSASCTPSRS